jgi:hypothetical protein
MVLHQITLEKEKLEQERRKFKLLFKQKKFEANQLQQKIHGKGILDFFKLNLYFLSIKIYGQM